MVVEGGGTDTSSNTTEFALTEILNKPEMMEKVKQELEDVVGKHNIVEESHIDKLPYLQAMMKETLRLHLALPLLAEEYVLGLQWLRALDTLLHSFDWKLPEGEKLDLSEKFGIVLKKKLPLVAIPTPRLLDLALYE
ncbi:flavonoid 3',5'-hydroxylase CYP75B138-like [Pyrus x bretschneideri]|uniref:flavonoid 3',5'-hydroxylase CYP75B138-like n=1 Tax=Pyrus x bretschneideri TaxID=225117 RepID=UPI0020308B93|nr:flavonoid 3',5'-hydroxylase CYP75B138-like [Pyrus x bretschneideri]